MVEKDEHSAVKRQQIINGAEIVFTESGFEGASMSRIALRAGVSKGTLYNYFNSKSDLFGAFVEQKAGTTLAHIFDEIGEDDDIDRTLQRIGERMAEIVISPAGLLLYRIVISEAGKFPHLAEIFWQNGPARAIRYMSDWLTQQVRLGRLRDMDVEFASEQFFALCQTRIGMRRRLQLDCDDSPAAIAEVIDAAVRVFLNSFGHAGMPAFETALAASRPRS